MNSHITTIIQHCSIIRYGAGYSLFIRAQKPMREQIENILYNHGVIGGKNGSGEIQEIGKSLSVAYTTTSALTKGLATIIAGGPESPSQKERSQKIASNIIGELATNAQALGRIEIAPLSEA